MRNRVNLSAQGRKHFFSREKILGQFCTPYEVAAFIVQLANVHTRGGLAIDPACGNGVFLRALIDAGFDKVIGIDVDGYIVGTIPGDIKERVQILVQDALEPIPDIEGKAALVVGNPPFSAKYGRVDKRTVLNRYELGQGKKTQAIEVLFLERFFQLAKRNGTMGIILPAGIFSSLPLQYVRDFILNNAAIRAIISLPRGIFSGNSSTTSKTYILLAEKYGKCDKVFMAIANQPKELASILDSYKRGVSSDHPPSFWVSHLSAEALYPEFYLRNRSLPEKGWLELGELVAEMFCGRTRYGSERVFSKQGVPYLSAKTVTKFGLNLAKDGRFVDLQSAMYIRKAHVEVGDLLFVRVGVGCIGRAAVVTDHIDRGVADDYIYIIRLKDRDMAYYVALYLQSYYGRCQVEVMKRGVGTVTVPQKLLKKIKLPIPTNSLKNEIKKLYLNMIEQQRNNKFHEAEQCYNEALRLIEEYAGRE